MSQNWTQNVALPGRIKPIVGAAQSTPSTVSAEGSKSNSSMSTKNDQRFKQYENSVSDVWDSKISVNHDLVHDSANRVLARHAQNEGRDLSTSGEPTYPPQSKTRSDNYKTSAMQRLAMQKDPPPSVKTATANNTVPSIYPRLPEVSQLNFAWTASTPIKPPKQEPQVDRDESRFDRLRRVIKQCDLTDSKNAAEGIINLEQLRRDCWLGIPNGIRPMAWRILSGYIPVNIDRQQMTVERKRNEYWQYVEQYFHTRYDEQHQDTFRQIHIDIPRMCPLIPLFQQKMVQEIFERILYIWAIRHPASGYVQGINDLVTPFFVVFLSEYVPDGANIGRYDITQVPRERMEIIEADSFWCFTSLLDTIQDNYTFAQPGIQRKVNELKYLLTRIDGDLTRHLERNQVEFLQFSFRWMNNILMREIPLRATIRLWDTYLSERNGFSEFHTYVCAAFLRLWSRQLLNERDFQGIMILLQNLPTQEWSDQQICELTADAYSLMQVFHGAKRHLQQES
ncbi:hypothetical protein M3Y94_00269900 [Aphelenchoides besseyi]|nr:hypothetical protein M3Y94_00269900 [Aphelenchoides besseyi]